MSVIKDGNIPQGKGYLLVDQTNVHAELPVGTKRYFEADTYTCKHCTAVSVIDPKKPEEIYRCGVCKLNICLACAVGMKAGEICRTWQQKYEEHMEACARQDASIIIRP